jgi:uncharacterized protein
MRKLTETDLDQLDEYLLGLDEDAMLLGTLEGFLAGVVICPDLILPSEWLPKVWGERGPAFEDEGEANKILQLIIGRSNEIARGLMRKGRYRPLLTRDADGTFLWELWAEGFAAAAALRVKAAWDPFAKAPSEEVRDAFRFLQSLAGAAREHQRLERALDDELRERGEEMIATRLEILNAARLRRDGRGRRVATPELGRNSPCPCGSGKKFKSCCLN